LIPSKNKVRIGSQKLIKEINQVLLFNTIRERGPISRAQLAKELSLSPTTVTVIVDYFMANGFLIETGKGDSSGGRKPVLVKLTPNAGHVIAVDLEQYRAAILNLEAEILFTKILPRVGKKEWLASLLQVIHELIQACGPEVRLLGIGIAVPGIIDSDKGKVLTASNLDINHVSLKEELQEHFQVPILLENDANAAAFGEYLYGHGQQVDNFLYLHVGKAVGAGLFLSGSLFTGGAGGAGEFGHISVDPSGTLCHCGNIGCLGKLISEPFLIQQWRQWTGIGIESGTPSLIELVELSNKGDEIAERLMDFAGELLGRGVVTLVNLFNPTLILLGGELALNNTRMLQQVKNQVELRSLSMFSKHVRIQEGKTRLNAGIIGAGSLALHYFFENVHMDLITK
jgi:N-acetylglucosamine repressor